MSGKPIYIEGGYRFYSPVCIRCKHWTPTEHFRSCQAFSGLDAIPVEIWNGENKHTTPYPGDNGIQFEPKPAGEGKPAGSGA